MTESDSSARYSEGMRKQYSDDLPLELLNNIELYSEVRLDKIRDQHIMYSRSVYKNIVEGKPLDYIVTTLSVEIPAYRMDIALTRQLINHFLEEGGQAIRFDEFLNIVDGETIIQSSGLTNDMLEDYAASELLAIDAHCQHIADAYAPRFSEGSVHTLLLAMLRGDIISEDLDVTIVAAKLNANLETMNSSVRFDRYLNQTA